MKKRERAAFQQMNKIPIIRDLEEDLELFFTSRRPTRFHLFKGGAQCRSHH
jgi:hypothetical protein